MFCMDHATHHQPDKAPQTCSRPPASLPLPPPPLPPLAASLWPALGLPTLQSLKASSLHPPHHPGCRLRPLLLAACLLAAAARCRADLVLPISFTPVAGAAGEVLYPLFANTSLDGEDEC